MQCESCQEDRVLVKIIDASGEKILCPNCLALLALNHEVPFENSNEYTCDITGNRGAIKYQDLSDGETYLLNKSAFIRLIQHKLTPEEYKILVTKYSSHNFMLHDDFYDEDGNWV